MAVSMTPAMQAEIRILPGNDKCVDCGSNHPQWASVTYGALMCLECSGAHRGMGVHISFVRSVTMDSWSDKQLKMMTHSSNDELVAFGKNMASTRACRTTPNIMNRPLNCMPIA